MRCRRSGVVSHQVGLRLGDQGCFRRRPQRGTVWSSAPAPSTRTWGYTSKGGPPGCPGGRVPMRCVVRRRPRAGERPRGCRSGSRCRRSSRRLWPAGCSSRLGVGWSRRRRPRPSSSKFGDRVGHPPPVLLHLVSRLSASASREGWKQASRRAVSSGLASRAFWGARGSVAAGARGGVSPPRRRSCASRSRGAVDGPSRLVDELAKGVWMIAVRAGSVSSSSGQSTTSAIAHHVLGAEESAAGSAWT